METGISGSTRLALAHVFALVGTALVAGTLFFLLLGKVDPYSSHTNAESGQLGAMLALGVYGVFVFSLATIHRLLRRQGVPMAVSIYGWALLAGPPALLVAALGLGSTY